MQSEHADGVSPLANYRYWLLIVCMAERNKGCLCYHVCDGECHYKRPVGQREMERALVNLSENDIRRLETEVQRISDRRRVSAQTANQPQKLTQREYDIRAILLARDFKTARDEGKTIPLNEFEWGCLCLENALDRLNLNDQTIALWEERRNLEKAQAKLSRTREMARYYEGELRKAENRIAEVRSSNPLQRAQKRLRMSGTNGQSGSVFSIQHH